MILEDIKTIIMFSSHVMMTYTFLIIVLHGSMTWSEPNLFILYSEMSGCPQRNLFI